MQRHNEDSQKSLIATGTQVDKLMYSIYVKNKVLTVGQTLRPLQLGSNTSNHLPRSHKSAHHFIRLPPSSPNNSLFAHFTA